MADGGGIEPRTLRYPWFSGPVASHLAAPSETGTPGRIRIDNLRLLSAVPLPVGLPGRNWCARCDSNAPLTDRISTCFLCPLGYPRLVRTAGVEPAKGRGLGPHAVPVRNYPTPSNWSPRGVLTSYLSDESRVSRPLDDGAWKPASGTIRTQRGFKGRSTAPPLAHCRLRAKGRAPA